MLLYLRRLDDDERLDALLDQLQKRVPSLPNAAPFAKKKQPTTAAVGGKQVRSSSRRISSTAVRGVRQGQPAVSAPEAAVAELDVRPGSSGGSSSRGTAASSVKSEVARELRAVRDQIQQLEARARQKATNALC
jgi:hypothetical protein